jgi:hypothetical protein
MNVARLFKNSKSEYRNFDLGIKEFRNLIPKSLNSQSLNSFQFRASNLNLPSMIILK